MINPISHGSYIQQLQKYDTCKYNQNVCNNNNTDIKVPSFKESQALLAMNGILFRSSILPKETTYLYNKKTNNKESLELTNLHVYEYPDTNLQVFINEIPNKEKRDDLRVSFLLKSKNNENDSSIKKKLLMGILKESLLEHNIDANINENNTNFINIDFNNTSGINKIVILNKLVTNPQITEAQLEKSKKELIEYINLPKYEKETLELKNLINKSLFRSKDELIKEIQNITPADIYTYHSNIIKNTEAQYFITVDKNFFDNNKLAFYSALNKNISTKFQKNSNNQLIEPMYIKNPKNIVIKDDSSDSYLSFHYPVNIQSNKNKLIYKYLTLMEIFWGNSYISEDSDGHKYTLPLELKDGILSPNALGFVEFNYIPTGNENIDSTEDAIVVFKAILEKIYEEERAVNTLESIKNYEKELLAKELNNISDSKNSHEILQNYGYDIFRIYETIDSISINDIKQAIEYTFFEQEPIIIINETLNPYKTNKYEVKNVTQN